MFKDLLTGAETAVYADSAYASVRHDDLLKQQNLKNGILKRAYRNRPLTKTEKQPNKPLSSIRSTVEWVFGILKLHYGMGRARHLGKARNHARLLLMRMAYKLKRGLAIQRSGMAGC